MKFYDFHLISKVYEYFGAHYARMAEIALLAGASYLIGVILTGQVYSFQALIVAIFTPVWAGINKRLRDLDKYAN